MNVINTKSYYFKNEFYAFFNFRFVKFPYRIFILRYLVFYRKSGKNKNIIASRFLSHCELCFIHFLLHLLIELFIMTFISELTCMTLK